MMFKVRYYLEGETFDDPLNWDAELCFVPQAKLWMDVGDGDYRQVESVYWREGNSIQELAVWFYLTDESIEHLQALGWRRKQPLG